MVMLADHQPTRQTQKLAQLAVQELHSADPGRFGRITVRGLYCGFIELDGVVSSYYVKSLALEIVRRIPQVADVVDLIRVAPIRHFETPAPLAEAFAR